MRPDFRTPAADPAILREVHAGFVGMTLFCPTCRAVLDCARAVNLDARDGDRLIVSQVLCAPCFDTIAPDLIERPGLVYEITDGRALDYPHA